jgi:RimJ/RimL family protein N-acetyltransferase
MIYSKNIRFRAPEKNDIPKWVEWLNDPDVIKGLTIRHPLGLEDELVWFETMMKRPTEEHPMVIEVKDGKTWQMVGNIGFHQFDWLSANAEVGIFIGNKDYWSKGIGTEAMLLMLKYGFESLNLHRIWLRVLETNEKAIRCYLKAGFVKEGTFRDGDFRRGKYINVNMMSVLRTEWKIDWAHGV